MLTFRITYFPGGVRHITFFGREPTGKRLTLPVPEPRGTITSC